MNVLLSGADDKQLGGAVHAVDAIGAVQRKDVRVGHAHVPVADGLVPRARGDDGGRGQDVDEAHGANRSVVRPNRHGLTRCDV